MPRPKGDAALRREAERLQGELDAIVQPPRVLVELAFNSDPLPISTTAERLARSSRQPPAEVAIKPAPSPRDAAPAVPGKPSGAAEPRGRRASPVGAWHSKASRARAAWSSGAANREF